MPATRSPTRPTPASPTARSSPRPRPTRWRSSSAACRRAERRRSEPGAACLLRGVALVEHQRVAVRVLEDVHVADAAVDRVAELDPLPLELGPRRRGVLNL